MKPLAGVIALALAAGLAGFARADATLRVWTLEGDDVRGDGADRPLPVGSLQKPFVLRAWAGAHPGERPPSLRCEGGSQCWRPSGHGELGLEAAVAQSCNAYFRSLAADTPSEVLADTLRAHGFALRGSVTPGLAIGLPEADAELRIAPGALLRAYRELTRRPWPQGEALRPRLLAGLRAAALTGTARGLGQRGYWAKTGTVPALDGRPLSTSGLALVIDDAGFGLLALLEHGTGREAAAALGPTLARLRPWTLESAAPVRPEAPRASVARAAAGLVRVRLFDALRPARVLARNLGSFPVSGSLGFVGSGARLELRRGQRLGEGLWELSLPDVGLTRRLVASLEVGEASGRPVVRADLTLKEYVSGVLAAESPAPDLRVAAGAAVLRFLEHGPRHADAQVCDRTHCAFFVGRGPRVVWVAPRLPLVLPAPPGGGALADPAREWEQIQALARAPGPSFWSSHCGGAPLSAFYVWGSGAREATACPRHAVSSVPAWRRSWPDDALRRALGFDVRTVAVDDVEGVWSLRLLGPAGSRLLRFDEAHRLLASELGWDALPSPASRVLRAARGFEAEGRGFGHRVGLCLDGPDGTRPLALPERLQGQATTR